jgi:hypothetical protein
MEELEKTFLEEYNGGLEQFETEKYKNANILLSKSLFALFDIIISQKLGKLPKNHSERFRILEEYFPEIYPVADKLFGLYTDAYNKPILKENCERIKDGIKQITRIMEVPEQIKKAVEQ